MEMYRMTTSEMEFCFSGGRGRGLGFVHRQQHDFRGFVLLTY